MTKRDILEYFCDLNYVYNWSNKLDTLSYMIDKLLEEQPKWISVNDRLPEEKMNPLTQDFAEVICFCDFGGRPKRTDIRMYGFGTASYDDKPHFWHGPQIMDGVITHWMPMPEPPMEGEPKC